MDIIFDPALDPRLRLFAAGRVLDSLSRYREMVASVHVSVRRDHAREVGCRLHVALRPAGGFAVDASASRVHECVDRAIEQAWCVLEAESTRGHMTETVAA